MDQVKLFKGCLPQIILGYEWQFDSTKFWIFYSQHRQFWPKNLVTLLFNTEAVVRTCSIKKVVVKNFAPFTGKHLSNLSNLLSLGWFLKN